MVIVNQIIITDFEPVFFLLMAGDNLGFAILLLSLDDVLITLDVPEMDCK